MTDACACHYLRSGWPGNCSCEGVMSKVLIAGTGNVLLGDDGVGPFVIKVLESEYTSRKMSNSRISEQRTDLPLHIAGADAVIFVDSAKFGGEAGDIRLFRKEEIIRNPRQGRTDRHSPALSESLSLLELTGAMPREFLMIGMQGSCFKPGSTLSTRVRQCIPHIIMRCVGNYAV